MNGLPPENILKPALNSLKHDNKVAIKLFNQKKNQNMRQKKFQETITSGISYFLLISAWNQNHEFISICQLYANYMPTIFNKCLVRVIEGEKNVRTKF